MMFDRHTQDYVDVITFFQRLPMLELQCHGVDAGAPMPRAVADLVRDWRRMQHVDLPESLCMALAQCGDDMLFNVVGYCLDILLRRIVPKYDRRRERKREKKGRSAARKAAADHAALAAALSNPAGEESAEDEESVEARIEPEA